MRPASPSPCPSPGEDEALAPVASVAVRRWQDGQSGEGVDWVCEEQPVSLEYNGIAYAVMMATPTALEDFALGFSLTEGIVGAPEEILDTELRTHGRGLCVAMHITARRAAALRERRRTLAGRTGCGLCGVDSLAHFDQMPAPVGATQRIDATVLAQAMQTMARTQPLRELTGATHAAVWMAGDGSLHALREDVGRHNALDKTVGALRHAGLDPAEGALLVTSRASYEMVQKAAAAGAGVLAAVSAPTALAIRTAQALNLTLVAFARGQRHVVYSHAWRLQAPGLAEGACE
ncbi:MAG: formate dehydrogenase family accessory protein FdhD [Rubrivivax sp. SCN 71-131]|nr:MAG: formate dehydrogenase family accessory protein FdhD [Rubrivivax sp. SCN 71-131]